MSNRQQGTAEDPWRSWPTKDAEAAQWGSAGAGLPGGQVIPWPGRPASRIRRRWRVLAGFSMVTLMLVMLVTTVVTVIAFTGQPGRLLPQISPRRDSRSRQDQTARGRPATLGGSLPPGLYAATLDFYLHEIYNKHV